MHGGELGYSRAHLAATHHCNGLDLRHSLTAAALANVGGMIDSWYVSLCVYVCVSVSCVRALVRVGWVRRRSLGTLDWASSKPADSLDNFYLKKNLLTITEQ